MTNKRTYEATERIGLNAVDRLFTGFGWIFREQPIADFGIDAQVEVTTDRVPSGQLLALQIKTGISYFRGNAESVVFYTDDAHMRYWGNLILHNPDSGVALWQWADYTTAEETDKGWRIEVSRSNVLDDVAKEALTKHVVTDPEFNRRQRFAADKTFMAEFIDREAYVTIDVWVNKHLKIREIAIRFDDPDKTEADFIIPVEVTWGYDVDDVMAHFFPWLEYSYANEIEDGAGEVEGHTFNAVLTEAAKAYLLAEKYFEQGVPRHQELAIVDRPDDEERDQF